MQTRPTLLSSCALAATAAEARFRIDASPRVPRACCVVALDERAKSVVNGLARSPLLGTRFFSYRGSACEVAGSGVSGELADILLEEDGARQRLNEVLIDADFMLMVATVDSGAAAASAIGNACTLRGIMTAGVVLGGGYPASGAVAALRPHTRVLLVSNDQQDVAEIMSAVGA